MLTNTFTSQQKIIAFFLRHPKMFPEIISSFYAFKEEELEEYQSRINWGSINQNEAIVWDEKLILKYNSRLNWYKFSQNAAFADTYLLETFRDQIDWDGEVMDGFGFSIASGTAIAWTSELIEKYQDRLNFNYLSINQRVQWSEQLIDQYKHRWNWDNLMMNDSIPWTLPMLNRFISHIDTSKFHFQFHPILTGQLDILEAYPGVFSMRAVCLNPDLPWKEKDLLKRWKNRLDWNALAANVTLFEDPSFFEKHLDKWLINADDNFRMLSQNPALPWSIPFLERFANFWDWEILSQHSYLPWSIKLIDYFQNYWEWGGRYMAEITEDEDGNRLPEPFKLVESFSHGLVTNPYLPWSLDLISKYEDRFDFEQLADNKGVWEKVFKPYLDEKTVDTIFRLI